METPVDASDKQVQCRRAQILAFRKYKLCEKVVNLWHRTHQEESIADSCQKEISILL